MEEVGESLLDGIELCGLTGGMCLHSGSSHVRKLLGTAGLGNVGVVGRDQPIMEKVVISASST